MAHSTWERIIASAWVDLLMMLPAGKRKRAYLGFILDKFLRNGEGYPKIPSPIKSYPG
jgi:hypothetical protein